MLEEKELSSSTDHTVLTVLDCLYLCTQLVFDSEDGGLVVLFLALFVILVYVVFS